MWKEPISWQNISSPEQLKIYKNQIVTHTFFYHFFYFYNSSFIQTDNINFIRIKQKNYKYDYTWNSYIEKFHIAYVQQSCSKQYAWFVLINKNEVYCLHKALFTYVIKGYINKNVFHPVSKIDYLSYLHKNNKDNKILNFLLNNLMAMQLLINL